MDSDWQVATDGERVLGLGPSDEGASSGKAGGDPLLVTSIDLLTGELNDPQVSLPEFNGELVGDQLVCTANGIAYVVAGRGKFVHSRFTANQTWYLFAVDLSTGKRLWTTPLPARRSGSVRLYFLSAAVVGRDLVALQEANDGTVHAVVRDTRSGAVRWDRPLAGVKASSVQLPLVTDARHLYLGAGELRALRLRDGRTAWESKSSRPGRTYGPPALKNGTLYAIEKGLGMVALDPGSGRVKWEEQGGQGVEADLKAVPVIGTDHAYSRRASKLWAIDLSSHAPTDSYRTTGNRFIAHEKSRTVISMGGNFLAAFPLR